MQKHRNIALELICVVQFWGVDLLLFLGCQMVPKQSPPHLGFQVPMDFLSPLSKSPANCQWDGFHQESFHEQKPCLFRAYRGWNPTQLWGDYIINHYFILFHSLLHKPVCTSWKVTIRDPPGCFVLAKWLFISWWWKLQVWKSKLIPIPKTWSYLEVDFAPKKVIDRTESASATIRGREIFGVPLFQEDFGWWNMSNLVFESSCCTFCQLWKGMPWNKGLNNGVFLSVCCFNKLRFWVNLPNQQMTRKLSY